MTSIDWKALKPHVPLPPGAAEYVEMTGSAGDKIAQWILADRSPLLVGGPAGVGKSTELARAAELLQPDRVACLVQLDRFENMRRLTPDRMRLRIAQKVGYLAQNVLHLPLSASLTNALDKVNAELRGESVTHEATPSVLLNVALTEILRVSKQGRLTLLIDGLEKVPQGPESLDLFAALASIHDEVELVVVIPWHAAFGPQAETVIRTGERFIAVRALDVEGDAGEPGREVLRKILLQRLRWPEEEFNPDAVVGTVGASLDQARARVAARRNLVNDAIRWSGGLPRVFLQLLADAGSYAKLRRSDPWPIVEDLNDACADQVDSFRRLLLPGDVNAIRGAAGTIGSELDLDRKIRLMAHGILLERVRDGAPVLAVHPLAQAAFDAGSAHA
ncbi:MULTISPECIES: ATP-binding protein [Sorangium]|uniref:Uncharacterized protein n=1 Tax=Sorangium cellulosum TaxID=56 RepID=A0A4P2QJG0_SORCE|nr:MULTISPECIES: ATP-binding protein [Sorangium]AUX29553.1 uncharacterized protein SOCE836_016440 [Sorangium cellulosum]WCQ88949.1 hypothetical protein NQZ70_01632 [Sorangium sp. Soce836]